MEPIHQLIASTLFQKKICSLPGVGTLVMVPHSAEIDFINTQIKAPFETIEFIASPKNEQEEGKFSPVSDWLLQKIKEKSSLLLEGIGTFSVAKEGNLLFEACAIDSLFVPAVTAERVIRPEAAHAMLVGDQQTNTVVMTEYFSEKKPLRDLWWVWAILLAGLAIGGLSFYIYQYGIGALGNVHHY